jgi:hypothetical protein
MEKDIRGMIDAIRLKVDEEEAYLSEWESDFLDSIERQGQQHYKLTEKQDACLERIWKRICI